MADENIEEVYLTPKDIPVAAVENKEIGKLTVHQLKCWLRCRRINQRGNKQALYDRLSSCFCLNDLNRIRLFRVDNRSVSFYTGSKISIPCLKLGKTFTTQTRTSHIRRPKLLNAEKCGKHGIV